MAGGMGCLPQLVRLPVGLSSIVLRAMLRGAVTHVRLGDSMHEKPRRVAFL